MEEIMIERFTVDMVEVSSIVPENWAWWFYSIISENAPFSWGDNNRTLVTASRFYDHVKECLEINASEVPEEEIQEFLKVVEDLGETYIDLEN
jgi:hypothetical protein